MDNWKRSQERRAIARSTEDAACLIERRLFVQWSRSEALAGRWPQLDAASKDFRMKRTLLAWAANSGDLEAIEFLLPISDIESRDIDSATPLFLAASSWAPEVVEALLRAGARCDATNIEGWTPLMRAAFLGDLDTLRILAGVSDPSAQAKDGTTALMLAALRKGQGPEACEILLSVSNPSIQDDRGLTALDHSRRSGNLATEKPLECAIAIRLGMGDQAQEHPVQRHPH